MKIRHLRIRNFRGIKELDWSISGSVVCLIGAGDSTKSTILSAIEYALHPSWNLGVSDVDFFNQDFEQPIEIVATVGELTDQLLGEDKFGLYLRGWNEADGLKDEPDDADERVLSIRLRVDKSLEPEWAVTNDRTPDGVYISPKVRESLAVSSVGTYLERHLAWGKGSALHRLTGNLDGASDVLNEALRSVRANLANNEGKAGWESVCAAISVPAQKLGVITKVPLTPGLDVRGGASISGTLALFEGTVPTRLFGTGSRRLLTIAIQRPSAQDGAILLLDEIEHGLEPHRLRHLLRQLCLDFESNPSIPGSGHSGQVFLTTHSSVTVVECDATRLHVVRCNDGLTTVTAVGGDMQGLVRGSAECMLSRKVIVCEGKTEVGLCRALDRLWTSEGDLPFAYEGVVPVQPADRGGATQAPQAAIDFAALGYETALIVDSDVPISPNLSDLESAGVTVIQWSGNCAIEQRVCKDVTWETLSQIITAVLADPEKDESATLGHIASYIKSQRLTGGRIDGWVEQGNSEEQIRNAIAQAAKKKCWFKRTDTGEHLGMLVAADIVKIAETNLGQNVNKLRAWVHA